MNIECSPWVKSGDFFEPTGESKVVRLYASLLQKTSIVLGIVWSGEIYKRNTEPLCPLAYPSVFVIRDDSNYFRIQIF